jgi:hypothetical protein
MLEPNQVVAPVRQEATVEQLHFLYYPFHLIGLHRAVTNFAQQAVSIYDLFLDLFEEGNVVLSLQ